MTSPDVVAPALLLPIPLLSFGLSLYNSFTHPSNPFKPASFLLLAILSAAAAATALSVACGQPLRIVAKVFTILLRTTLSGISIYALSSSLHPSSPFPPPFLSFSLALASLLVACELISALIPTSPLLLPATIALVSRVILLILSIAAAIFLYRQRPTVSTELDIEKGQPPNGKSLGRVSSPTQATWPFPGSLALHHKSQPQPSPPDKSTPPIPSPPSTVSPRHHVAENAYTMHNKNFILFPLVLVLAQLFATLAASFSITACMLVDATTNQPLPQILLVNALCMLMWSLMALAIIQMLPANPYSLENQVAIPYAQGILKGDAGIPRTPKPSLSRRESDSLLDFLSLRDPFASSPPPPPPLPPVGLGLDELDVGWNGNREISMQYRFPAPRSIVKGGRRKGKNARDKGKKCLAHQESSRTLLPVPETRGSETDVERDKGFGEEARLAQLLLQSLSEGGEGAEYPNATIPLPVVQSPQVPHEQPCSRWSASTTVQSTMSGSISNRSGVSNYTTCASDRVPPSRISMNTIASVLGSRKSSEAARKSAMTGSSSKG